MNMRTAAYLRQLMPNVGRNIDLCEAALEGAGYHAFRDFQKFELNLARSENEAREYIVYRKERASEIFSGRHSSGTHYAAGDGYASPFLREIREKETEKGVVASVVGRSLQGGVERSPFHTTWRHELEPLAYEKIRGEASSLVVESDGFGELTVERKISAIIEAAAQSDMVQIWRPRALGDREPLFAISSEDLSVVVALNTPGGMSLGGRWFCDLSVFVVSSGGKRIQKKMLFDDNLCVRMHFSSAVRGLFVYSSVSSLSELRHQSMLYASLVRWVIDQLAEAGRGQI